MRIPLDFNLQLVDILNIHIPQKANHVTFLMETLHLGKEASYRRLRNEVSFTFNEAALIALKLKISLDSLISGVAGKEIPSFQLYSSLYGFNEDYKCYFDSYNTEHGAIFENLMHDPTVKMISAYETIPHAILFRYRNISKFRAFKWHYQQSETIEPITFSAIQIDDEVFQKHRKMADRINQFPDSCLILGRNAFKRLIDEIKYFRNLYMINDEEIELLKKELHQIIDSLEEKTITGKSSLGKSVLIYLSNIDFDMDCTYIHGEEHEQSLINIYQMNALASIDPGICKMQKSWIDSLKKYSTLITQSAEKERVNFFKLQREFINEL